MADIKTKFGVDFRLTASRDHAESFALVVAGKADAFATDDVLLYGLIASNNQQRNYHVVGEFLSYDPYGIVYRRGDPQMKRLVEDAFRFLADDGEIERQYKRWFLTRLPAGPALGLPMSPQLESLIRAMAAKPE
jgi:glutamate/aspartate transport system substrate-binding protein